MGLLLLTNTIGNNATTVSKEPSGGTQPGYALLNVLSGPRNRLMRQANDSDYSVQFNGASRTATHCVVTRMDHFKNNPNAGSVRLQSTNDAGFGSGTWTTNETIDVGDIELIGVTRQDWVHTISATNTSFRLQFLNAGWSGFSHGKVYFSEAFSFGVEPQRSPEWKRERFERKQIVKPIAGHAEYAVEDTISLSWRLVALAKVQGFEALSLGQPFFLYDESGDIFDHHLEHVLCEAYDYERVGANLFTVNATFRRLAHYQ